MRSSLSAWGFVLLLASGLAGSAAEAPDLESRRLERIAGRPETARAREALGKLLPSILEDQIALARIPAPSGREDARARWMFERLRELELLDVHIDDAGNVIGRRPGRIGKPAVILSAHLDTVFDLEAVDVVRDGNVLRAPGIGDDARGLASVLGLLRALRSAQLETDGDLWLAFTAGEEGLGDLKGSKHLYAEGQPGRGADAFLSLDVVSEATVVHRALGSLRLKVVLSGQGGHSWADFGRSNAIQALGRAMSCMASEPSVKPGGPRASFNFGRVGGGTSINAIPQSAWVEVDLRSEEEPEVRRLELKLDACVRGAVEAERAWARPGEAPLKAELQVVGRRPSGVLAQEQPLVRLALASSRMLGIEPKLEGMSTDANVPISLGLPALALGYGGRGGDAHSPSEWYDPTGCERAMERNLLLLLALLERPD